MVDGLRREVHVLADPESVSRAAADCLSQALREAVASRGEVRWAVSGGETPRRLYEILADRTEAEVPWSRSSLYWADERWVEPSSPDSNYQLVASTLLRNHPIPPERLFPIPTQKPTPSDSAQSYEQTLRETFPDPLFAGWDVTLLGVGPDGHTASIFPGTSPAADDRWVIEVARSPQPPTVPRISTTLRFLSSTRRIIFLVTGQAKSRIVRSILGSATGEQLALPAVQVGARESIDWFLDAAAAADLPDPTP